MIVLGTRVRDRLTGFEGTAVGRTEWMYGCTRIGIEPTELKNGKPVEAQWFDEQRVEVVTPAPAAKSGKIGGPQNDPARPSARP